MTHTKKAARRKGSDAEAAVAAVLRSPVKLTLPSVDDIRVAWRKHVAKAALPPPSAPPPPAAPPPPPPPPPSQPLPPPSTPIELTDDRTEYLHPVGYWCFDGPKPTHRWRDESIPGYRGCPGGDDAGRFWNPEKPPCVPSDHRPTHLFTSREAAEAAGVAERVEFLRMRPDEDGEDEEFDDEAYELVCVKHKHALRRLHASHQLAEEHHTRPCPCGHGALAMWPWVVQTAALGFCECEMASLERICWRSEWIKAAGCSHIAFA